MRPLEMVVIAAGALLLLRNLAAPRSGYGLLLAVVVLVLVVAQLLIEGWRKPLLPAYAAALVLITMAAAGPMALLSGRLLLAIHAVIVMLLLGALLFATVRPAVRYPVPQGPHAVGTVELATAVPFNPAAAIDVANPPPRFRIWYPARPPDRRPWFGSASLMTRVRALGTAWEPLAAEIDAPFAADASASPVLVYFPGWPGLHVENHVLLRELASHGYVIASIEYPARLPGMTAAQFDALEREQDRPLYFGSEADYRELVAVSLHRVRSRARDGSLALDRLAALHTGDPTGRFTGRLDLERIGAIGFSFGGAVAAQIAWQDPRIRAAINIDGRHWAEGREQGVRQPYLWLTEPLLMPTTEQLQSPIPDLRYNAEEDIADYTTGFANLRRHGGAHVTINGTWHMNFTDAGLRSPLRRYNLSGPIDPLRALVITNAYVLGFFDQSLNGRASPLYADDIGARLTPYPEVIVDTFRPTPPQIESSP